MIFKIVRINQHSIDGSHDLLSWELQKVGGEVIARGVEYGSEDACRGAIAEFKKAGSGLKFAKVKSPDPKEAR